MITSLADFNNKKVLIMGLGTKGGGVESARFAYKHGSQITITDLKNEKSLKKSLELISDIQKKLVLGGHQDIDFMSHDIIIKNPGIKDSNAYIQTALRENKTIECPIGIFLEIVEKPFIGITGTKGKSFTTNLVNHILSYYGLNSVAAGNNCVSPLRYLGLEKDFVLELSSWQLKELKKHKKSPNVACWLNFFEDHLNFYDNTQEYFEDKKNILEYQKSTDYCILPLKDSNITASNVNSKKILFTSEELNEKEFPECFAICYVKDDYITINIDGQKLKLLPVSQLRNNLLIPHHFELVIASICTAYTYLKEYHENLNFKEKPLLQAVNSFMGLEHRFEILTSNSKTTVINDSAASTPESVILALKSCCKTPVTLILGGGGHKNLSFAKLAEMIRKDRVFVILFNKDKTSELIVDLLNNLQYKNFIRVNTLKEATIIGYNQSVKDNGTLLLSSGCSGSPFFIDMFERGNLFKEYIINLINVD